MYQVLKLNIMHLASSYRTDKVDSLALEHCIPTEFIDTEYPRYAVVHFVEKYLQEPVQPVCTITYWSSLKDPHCGYMWINSDPVCSNGHH